MRCTLDYEDDKTFEEQSVNAWGVMQSLSEDPCYREDDIKDPRDRAYFCGYKAAIDESINSLRDILFDYFEDDNESDDYRESVYDESDSDEILKKFKEWCSANICMMLFSILDAQTEREEIDT